MVFLNIFSSFYILLCLTTSIAKCFYFIIVSGYNFILEDASLVFMLFRFLTCIWGKKATEKTKIQLPCINPS